MKNKGLKLLLLAGALLLTGCGNKNSSISSNPPSSSQVSSSSSSEESKYENLVTIKEALQLAKDAGSSGTSKKYTVIGKIKEIKSYDYGDMTITDGTNELFIYGPRGADGETYFNKLESAPSVGDEVVLYGTLKDYNGTLEMDHPAILEFTPGEQEEFDETQYTAKTVKEARNIAKGEKVKVTGVVAYITKAFGYTNDGFYLVDGSESIYIYGSNVATKVKVGNTVTVCGTKDYFVAENEASNATKFGYKGCNQISSATITANDDKTTGVWDSSWVKEKTVKEIMDTPATQDITTTIYKVTALVKKVIPASNDFVNYYINDLDGYTGSYVYTKNSGGDFSYLDEYDGKICTVYLSVINAKSSSSGCLWRFMPIGVEEDTDFSFDMTKSAEFSYDYYLNGKIESTYSNAADAQVKLPKSSTNDLLDFKANYTYTSSNPDVLSFEVKDEEVVMHTTNTLGKSTVSIQIAVEGGNTITKTIEVEVKEKATYDVVSIEDVIASSNDTEVTVQGIVVSSLVNQTGFYLQDETGIIAVTGQSDDVSSLTPGDEVVIKGKKGEKHKGGATDCTKAPQINIYNAELLENFHGNHSYSSDKFITGKTIDELYNLSVTDSKNYTTSVYVVTGIITFEQTQSGSYSTVVAKLYNENKTVGISLYCSSANQYKQFESVEGKLAIVEVAITNWNCKSYYTGCVISASVGTTKIVNTLNFSK